MRNSKEEWQWVRDGRLYTSFSSPSLFFFFLVFFVSIISTADSQTPKHRQVSECLPLFFPCSSLLPASLLLLSYSPAAPTTQICLKRNAKPSLISCSAQSQPQPLQVSAWIQLPPLYYMNELTLSMCYVGADGGVWWWCRERKKCVGCPVGRRAGQEDGSRFSFFLNSFIYQSHFYILPTFLQFFSNLFNFILFLSYDRLSYQSSIFLFSVNLLLCLGNPIRSLCFMPYGFNSVFHQSLHNT